MNRLYKSIYLCKKEIINVYKGLELVWERYVPTPIPNPGDDYDLPDPGDGHNPRPPRPPREKHTRGGIKLLFSRFIAFFMGWIYDF